jgi:hypothetical protein
MIMESELWKKAYQLIHKLGKNKRPKRAAYTNADIVSTYLWAVLHDRPTRWACKRKNWPIYYRRRTLPDPSTMCRRLRTKGVQRLLRSIEKILIDQSPRNICRWIDAKGLRISNGSTDKQAGYGYAGGGMGKGYKIYAIADPQQGFVHWTVRPMNHKESKVARHLIRKLEPQGYLVGDGAYDANRLYDLAAARHVKLVAPQRIHNASGLAHRRHSPYRIEMFSRLSSNFVRGLLRSRVGIEHMFGHLTNIGCGLKPLPGWVRGLFRVVNWVRGKMIFYHIWKREIAPGYV